MKLNPISGYNLAKSIFRECEGKNVDALIDFAGGETDWLEVKAGLYARPEDCNPGEKPEDQIWSVSRAVFGFLNSSGGLLILGIDDKMEPVGLSGLKNPEDCSAQNVSSNDLFIRRAEDQLPPLHQKWITSKGTWTWDKATYRIPDDSVTFSPAKYRGKDVLLAFVQPIPAKKIVCVSKGREEEALVRMSGGRGRIKPISGFSELKEWVETERRVEQEDFAFELLRFKKWRKEALRPKTETGGLSKIMEVFRSLRDKLAALKSEHRSAVSEAATLDATVRDIEKNSTASKAAVEVDRGNIEKETDSIAKLILEQTLRDHEGNLKALEEELALLRERIEQIKTAEANRQAVRQSGHEELEVLREKARKEANRAISAAKTAEELDAIETALRDLGLPQNRVRIKRRYIK